MTTTSTPAQVRTARFGRRSTRGVVYGLSALRLAVVAAAVLVATIALVAGGPPGLLWTLPAWGSGLLVAYVPVKGRTIVEWAPVVTNHLWRRLVGQHRFRARPLKPRPAGTLALPGDAARLRILTDDVTGAALVHDPHVGTVTGVLRVTHPAFVLVDPATQAARAQGWGRLLGGLAVQERAGVARLQVLARALPDAGVDVREWWETNGRHDGSWMVSAYEELLTEAAPAAERHETLISVTVGLRQAARMIRDQGGGMRGAAVVMRQRMSALETAIRGADLTPAGWLDTAGLSWVLRTAYDPDAAHTLAGAFVGKDPSTAGPVAVDEEWGCLRSDTGWHAALWVSEWPRVGVVPGFLWPLVLAPQVRRSLSIVMDPVPRARALKDVRAERFDYLSDQISRDKRGQLTDYATTQELEDVKARERELAEGHGDLRFAAFIAVTAPTWEALSEAVEEIAQAAREAFCEVRVLWGEQGTGFAAAALPLGRGL